MFTKNFEVFPLIFLNAFILLANNMMCLYKICNVSQLAEQDWEYIGKMVFCIQY